MALFDRGPSINSISSAASSVGSGIQSAIGTVGQVAGVASRLAGALNNLSNPSALISQLRGINLPNFSMSGSAFAATRVMFAGPGNKDDWRVRLTIPDNFFASSPVLAPLKAAGGLVFPYTPTLSISSSASYDDIALTHQNYTMLAYQNSKVNEFTITGAFNVEDELQAQYWVAAVHFLRSATKMYTGDDVQGFQGSPPPILALNGYGDYVFKNVPVVVKSFNIELPADSNYISCTVGAAGFSAGRGNTAQTINGVAATANRLAGLAGNLGKAGVAAKLGSLAATGAAIGGVTSAISGVVNGLSGNFSTSSGATHVPVKSSLTISLQPVYSREAMRQFSLQKFVNGSYVNGTGGYV